MLSRFICPVFFGVVFFCLTACNSNEEKTTNSTTSIDTAVSTTTNETAPPSTIVTTPQYMLVAKHKVANFTKWKASYEAHDSLRLANGLHSYVIGRNPGDSNMILVVVKADDPDKAKAFTKDASLKQAMQKGGVTGTPVFSVVKMVWQDTATLSGPVRSLTTFTVKDWAAWEKSFQEGTQERLDNGLTVRTYGHDVDDNKKVSLVTAVLDSAKAAAYWKSDLLKKRREAGGVLGEPTRFLFRVVQRY